MRKHCDKVADSQGFNKANDGFGFLLACIVTVAFLYWISQAMSRPLDETFASKPVILCSTFLGGCL